MATRDILDYQGNKIGELNLPDETPEEIWQQKLAAFAAAPIDESFDRKILSVKERRQYCEELMEKFKISNADNQINALQAMWVHHRFRAFEVTFYGYPFTLDLLNLVVSGDVEIACLSLQQMQPDSMEQPFHFFTQERINFLVNDMKAYLGWI